MIPETTIDGSDRLEIRAGFRTETGARASNEDYVAWYEATPNERQSHGMVFALADGIGGAKGGRQAAESSVRSFIDGYYGQSALLSVQRNVARSLGAVNRWLHAVGRTDANLAGMGSTFTALILRGRQAHVVHIGDTRLYRLRDHDLSQLTTDHVPPLGGQKHLLTRSLGAGDGLRIDYLVEAACVNDRYLLCSDGVHGGLSASRLRIELGERDDPEATARRLVQAALDQRIGDNATALVIDVLALPLPNQIDLATAIAALPIEPPPKPGDTVDGIELRETIADGRYSRVLRGHDTVGNRPVVVKFPKPVAAADQTLRQAFLREAWIAARLASPWIGEMIELPPDRCHCLYAVMPDYGDLTLERRLMQSPSIPLGTGLAYALNLARAVAVLHRAGIIHRDIKPENVLLPKTGGLRLVDLGVARILHREDISATDAPGTPSYMAPELFDGVAGNELSDQFALGVTVYRLFCRSYPYGEIEPFTHPHFGRPKPLAKRRPDLPSWLDQVVARSLAVDPAARYGDVVELIFALEHGAAGNLPITGPKPLYHRNPLRFWQIVSTLLAVALIIDLLLSHHR